MNWQEELRINFEKEDYEQSIILLKKELTEPFCNDEDLSLNLMYVYMYMFMLKKSSNTESQMIFLSENILAVYRTIREKYKDSAKALFYTAYNSSIAEWILDLDIKDIKDMYYRAWLLEPNNKLYEYGYYQFTLENQPKANAAFEKVRNDEHCWNELKKMSILGDSLIEGMEYLCNRR